MVEEDEEEDENGERRNHHFTHRNPHVNIFLFYKGAKYKFLNDMKKIKSKLLPRVFYNLANNLIILKKIHLCFGYFILAFSILGYEI